MVAGRSSLSSVSVSIDDSEREYSSLSAATMSRNDRYESIWDCPSVTKAGVKGTRQARLVCGYCDHVVKGHNGTKMFGHMVGDPTHSVSTCKGVQPEDERRKLLDLQVRLQMKKKRARACKDLLQHNISDEAERTIARRSGDHGRYNMTPEQFVQLANATDHGGKVGERGRIHVFFFSKISCFYRISRISQKILRKFSEISENFTENS